MKILTIGGATLDTYLRIDATDEHCARQGEPTTVLALGQKIEVDQLLYFTGGGATNVATAFARLGFDTTCCAKIGKDKQGELILDELKTEGINTQHVATSCKEPTGSGFVINSPQGERTIFVYRGANTTLAEDDIQASLVDKTDLVYVTSLAGKSAYLLPIIAAHVHKCGISLVLNPGSGQLKIHVSTLKESIPFAKTLILNSSEASLFMASLISENNSLKKHFSFEGELEPQRLLLGKPLICGTFALSLSKYFSYILRQGPSTIVVTDGKEGVYVHTADGTFYHPALKTNVVDTLGAGDAFGSGFSASLARGDDTLKALFSGMCNATAVIETFGAKPGLLSKDELTSKLQDFDPSRIRKL